MFRRPIRLALITAAAFFGACCQPGHAPASDVVSAGPVASYALLATRTVGKFCDAGRAIYVANDSQGIAMAVHDDAPECVR